MQIQLKIFVNFHIKHEYKENVGPLWLYMWLGFYKLLMYWNFYTWRSLEFSQNGAETLGEQQFFGKEG